VSAVRGWWLFVVSVVLIALAYVGDRLLVELATWVGTYAGEIGRLGLSVGLAGILRVAAAVAIAALCWLAWRSPRHRAAGLAMIGLGLFYSLVVPAVLAWAISTRTAVSIPFTADLFWPAHLVRWLSTAIVLAGLVLLLRPSGASPVSSWSRRHASAWPWVRLIIIPALIGVAYLADVAMAAGLLELAAGTSGAPLLMDIVARFGTLASLLALSWVVVRGPRRRLIGALTLLAGLYVFAGVVISSLLGSRGLEVPIPGLDLLPYPGDAVRWLGAGLTLLGVGELLWPTGSDADAKPRDRLTATPEPAS